MEKKYTYYIKFRFTDYEMNDREVTDHIVIQADNSEEVAIKIKDIWDKNFESALKSGLNIFLDCDDIIRNSDGEHYYDDDTIPQGGDVDNELIDLLDPKHIDTPVSSADNKIALLTPLLPTPKHQFPNILTEGDF